MTMSDEWRGLEEELRDEVLAYDPALTSDNLDRCRRLLRRAVAHGRALEREEPGVSVSKLRATVAYWRERISAPGFAFKQMAHDILRDCNEAEEC